MLYTERRVREEHIFLYYMCITILYFLNYIYTIIYFLLLLRILLFYLQGWNSEGAILRKVDSRVSSEPRHFILSVNDNPSLRSRRGDGAR